MSKRDSLASITLLSFWLIIGIAVPVSAQDDAQAVASFEKRVDVFSKFFAERPLYLDKQTYRKSPTGYNYMYIRFEDAKVSYDVRRSDSLVSPYMGYVTVSGVSTRSQKCGIVPWIEDWRSAFSIEEVRQYRDDDACYTRPLSFSVRFVFAFQKQQWVFKDLEDVENTMAGVLWGAFGKPSKDRHVVEDNEHWLALVK